MKIAIAIMSCVKNAERREAVRRTWVKDIPFGIDYFFFVGHVGVSDAISLPCGDAYEDCAFKQIEMIKFVKDYDYVFFCDDDTYVVIDRLMLCGFEAHDYMGCPCMLYEECVAAHGGAGFWMSKKAMVAALDVGLDHPKFIKTQFSDQAVGRLLRIAGIKLKADMRFHLGKYVGNRGVCVLVPNRFNRYITTHFISPAKADQVYAHFHSGASLPQNVYTMSICGRRVDFSEHRGNWWYSVWGESGFRGEFAFAQEAENDAIARLMPRSG
jgi:hypothetical protein